MHWSILDTGFASAEANMAYDFALLQGLSSISKPILHFYDWIGNAATYGHFVNLDDLIDREAARKHHLDLAKRPTGGGIVFHQTDFAFSILVPASHPAYSVNPLDNYAFINQFVGKVVKCFLGKQVEAMQEKKKGRSSVFCMARPTQYDLMVEGKKVGGAAQRRTRQGFLHQGTIALALPPEELLKEVVKDTWMVEAMQKTTFCLGENGELKEARAELKKLLRNQVEGF